MLLAMKTVKIIKSNIANLRSFVFNDAACKSFKPKINTSKHKPRML